MRFLVVPVLLALAACAAPNSGGNPHLADSAWRFTRIDGRAAASSHARLTFTGANLGANVGCNGMGGTWRVEAGRLITGPLMQTEMFCEGPVWPQERSVSALLAGAPKFTVNGNRMMLASSGHSAELVRVADR